MSIMHHLQNFLVVHCLSKFLCCKFHFLEINNSSRIVVIQGKYFLKTLWTFAVSQSVVDDLQKLVKLNWPVSLLKVIEHVKNNLISFVETQLLKYFLNLLWVNFTSVIFVKQIKRRFQLIQLLLRKPLPRRSTFQFYLKSWHSFLSHTLLQKAVNYTI